MFKRTSKHAYEMLVPTIKKNLTRRRTEFDRIVKGTDDALKGLSPEQKVTAKSKGGIKKTVKKISVIGVGKAKDYPGIKEIIKLNKQGKKRFGMKMGGALKPVDPKTQKGLSKLPTEVRNKMGYMKKGGKVNGK